MTHPFRSKRTVLYRLVGLDGEVVQETDQAGGAAVLMTRREEGGLHVRRVFELDTDLTERDSETQAISVMVYREKVPPVPVCFRCGRTEREHELWEMEGSP